jgi:hypothetical protein
MVERLKVTTKKNSRKEEVWKLTREEKHSSTTRCICRPVAKSRSERPAMAADEERRAYSESPWLRHHRVERRVSHFSLRSFSFFFYIRKLRSYAVD